MSYRNIYIKKAKKLSYKNCSMIVTKEDDNEIVIPLEDIASVIVEDNRTVITSYLLAKISEYYICMILCNEHYLPVSMVTPINMHHRQLAVFYKQLKAKKTLISQIWTKVVRQKMINQMHVLGECTLNEDKVDELYMHIKDLKSNDKTNKEAIVASLYFRGLFGSTFKRRRIENDEINSALNYGYSLLASHMTRVLIMYGFNTNLGIHHESRSNSLNLSYDFIEPFRAVVDLYVYKHKDELLVPLSIETRNDLIELLQETVLINGKHYSVQNAMEEMVLSFIKCLDNDSSEYLVLPEMLIDETE